MSVYIKKTRDGANINFDVCAPLYKGDVKNEPIEKIIERGPRNMVNLFDKSSILSKMDRKSSKGFTSVSNMTCFMVCQIGDEKTCDEVKIIGEIGGFWVVEIGETRYSVMKSIATFVKD